MSVFRLAKVVSALPGTLTSDTLYLVRAGTGFDFYVSDSTGTVAHALNTTGGGGGVQSIDGGFASSVYTADQLIDGGSASG